MELLLVLKIVTMQMMMTLDAKLLLVLENCLDIVVQLLLQTYSLYAHQYAGMDTKDSVKLVMIQMSVLMMDVQMIV